MLCSRWACQRGDLTLTFIYETFLKPDAMYCTTGAFTKTISKASHGVWPSAPCTKIRGNRWREKLWKTEVHRISLDVVSESQ